MTAGPWAPPVGVNIPHPSVLASVAWGLLFVWVFFCAFAILGFAAALVGVVIVNGIVVLVDGFGDGDAIIVTATVVTFAVVWAGAAVSAHHVRVERAAKGGR